MKKITYIVLTLLGFSLVLAPALASAQGVGVSANATVTTPAGTVTMTAAAMANAKTRADKELQRRITALQDLNTRVQAMQEVTATFKQSLANAVQTQITAFQALNAKIQADTDGATLKADIQSITQSYRVYALVLPQIHIAAAADRAVAIVSMMQTLGTKLNARIQAAAQAGANVTALTAALNDLAAKISDANTQAQASVSGSASLTPDNGDKTVMASNTAALKASRKALQAVQQDLVAARKDILTIIKGLPKIQANATASSTTSVQQ